MPSINVGIFLFPSKHCYHWSCLPPATVSLLTTPSISDDTLFYHWPHPSLSTPSSLTMASNHTLPQLSIHTLPLVITFCIITDHTLLHPRTSPSMPSSTLSLLTSSL
uniref:Uncharacterized protein n=1 Tax=Octopus bimaculoides TaxID=37653 RepID=A0A0L8HSD1_OCTBM